MIRPDDIGGPMDIGSGYRWNVPVLTYGFDRSFLNYFGSNGITAVEDAIQILNALPPASNLILTNYPLSSQQFNAAASSLALQDLKSSTLSALLEQMGMAAPSRYVFVLRQWNPYFLTLPYENEWPSGTIPDYIVRRNFDPATQTASNSVNGSLYTGEVYTTGDSGVNYMFVYDADPFSDGRSIADINTFTTMGAFYTGLTYDDVGGLNYLLSTNTVNYETLLSGIASIGTNSFVNGARRPGVDKITFVAQPAGSLPGTFLPMTNQFTDTYITNGHSARQQLRRVTTQPDFLFSADHSFHRTGTTNWINNAFLNNNPTGEGPGIIQPPVVVAFTKVVGTFIDNGNDENSVQSSGFSYGSFGDSSNVPINYPTAQTGNVSMTVQVLLQHANKESDTFHNFEWTTNSQVGAVYAFQTSTNLSTWTTLFRATNNI
ncbi:MAG: hypothetical protein WCS94_20120, partial [Verrucomicrobiota bacterium]